MNDATKDKLTTLPTWARTRIERLEAELAHCNALLEQTFAGAEDTDTIVIVRPASHGSGDRRVPAGTTVHFYLGSDLVQAQVRGGELELRVVWDAHERHLNVEPVVSNILRVRITD